MFKEWLRYILQGSWMEFRRDCLAKAGGVVADPDKRSTAEKAMDCVDNVGPDFGLYHPDKKNWTVQDHHVRFIMTVVLDGLLSNLWSSKDWDARGLEISKAVYEVLCFLKASYDTVEEERD
ncbi:hypothetical protein UVI_02050660 [Ustilaginoidea virens]|uniref:Uncharacterized protein n=1 Tax=Ustilaginoidea virens TaxID=1159556 RepID=A0A1B5KZW7_USTVR|nr:hypothetical protein UVI_02050660 [Ustilaginoidea virens]